MVYLVQGSPLGYGLLDIPGASQVKKREHSGPNDVYELLLLYASHTWYVVRWCVFGCCIEYENVVMVRSSAVYQSPTNTPWLPTQRRELEARLPLYGCCTVLLLCN